MSESKNKARFFKPGIKDGIFYVHRKKKLEDGSYEDLPDFVIGGAGVAVTDIDLLETLDNHSLKGHRAGFYEVKSLANPKVVANGPYDAEKEVIPETKGNKKVKDDDINSLSIPETQNYIEENNLSDEQIVAFTSGDKEGRTGIKDIHDAAAKRLKAEYETEEQPEQETHDVISKDDITNINQLKDYVQDQPGVDGRSLTTPEKILAAAEQLDPPHEFPNLETGG